ncbi:probable uridine nucleosidase 1 [Aristolochia californica]|uniref:probable uridine nucleosidase 1 n=1 Tax=Aristolochia californica TaxID=171875 RepID=UPI0035DD156C
MEEKVIIDTDPGIDDSMAILMAFQTPELEILGLTTIYFNISTGDATRNALLLCEIAGCPDVPVAEGSPGPLKGGIPRVADFVHGSDGLGNIFLPPPNGKKISKAASDFMVDMVSEYPGEVSILALGPLTNLSLALTKDSSFASKVKKIIIVSGAFFSSGNVNPAAEANVNSLSLSLSHVYHQVMALVLIYMKFHLILQIFGDPEAADMVITCGAHVIIVGINITTQVKMTDEDLFDLRNSKGRHAKFICEMCQFYRDWHLKSDGLHGIFLHDPVSLVALVQPEFFTFKQGAVRVETQGICVGHTLMDQQLKKWQSSNPWTNYPPVSVTWEVDEGKVLAYIKNLLMKQ